MGTHRALIYHHFGRDKIRWRQTVEEKIAYAELVSLFVASTRRFVDDNLDYRRLGDKRYNPVVVEVGDYL